MDPLNDLPPTSRPAFDRLLAFELMPPPLLASQITRHLSEVEEDTPGRELRLLARRLASWSRRLLALYSEDRPEAEKRLLQAGILYFVLDRDSARDLHPGGLDDDLEVLRRVMQWFGVAEDPAEPIAEP